MASSYSPICRFQFKLNEKLETMNQLLELYKKYAMKEDYDIYVKTFDCFTTILYDNKIKDGSGYLIEAQEINNRLRNYLRKYTSDS